MTNSYHEGFSNTASAHGVDPAILLKYAEYCKEAGISDWLGRKFLGVDAETYERFKQNAKKLGTENATKAIDLVNDPTVTKLISGATKVKDFWNGLDPNMRRGLGGMALTGLGSMLFTDGNLFQRLIKGLGYGTLGGAAAYGLSRSGLYDKGIDYLAKGWGELNSNQPAKQPAQSQGNPGDPRFAFQMDPYPYQPGGLYPPSAYGFVPSAKETADDIAQNGN